MRDRAAGRQILGAMSFESIERVNGCFSRFSPNVSFALLSPEYQTTVHITQEGTRATGRDDGGPDTVVFAGDSFGMGVNEGETFVGAVCGARRDCSDASSSVNGRLGLVYPEGLT